MAEIKIERKRKPVWPYLLLLLLIALIAWGLYEFTNGQDKNEVEEVPATGLVIPVQTPPQLTLYATV